MKHFFLFVFYCLSLGHLSAQSFNLVKAYQLNAGAPQLGLFANGEVLVSSFDGKDLHLDRYSAQGVALASKSYSLNGDFSAGHAFEILPGNRVLLSLHRQAGCDLVYPIDHFDLLLNQALNIVDTLQQDLGFGPAMLFVDRVEPIDDSLYLVSGEGGFRLVAINGNSLSLTYDTLNFDFESTLVLNQDSLLIYNSSLANGNVMFFRISDQSFHPIAAYLPNLLTNEGDTLLYGLASSGTIQAYHRESLSQVNWNLGWSSFNPDQLFASDGKLIAQRGENYAVLDPVSKQVIAQGTLATEREQLGSLFDLKLKTNQLLTAFQSDYAEYHLESQVIGQGPAPIFQSLSYRLEALRQGSFDAIFKNLGPDTIHKVGVGIRSGGNLQFCQNPWRREIKSGLNILPGDSAVISFSGNPFYLPAGVISVSEPFVVYMVNDNMLKSSEQFPSKIISMPEGLDFKSWALFPNPVRDKVYLQYPALGADGGAYSSLLIYNSLGAVQSMPTVMLQEEGISLEVSHLSPGLYYLEMQSAHGSLRRSFLKVD